MADRASDRRTIEAAWSALGSRIAVAAGASSALVSLLHDVPPHVAAVRGAAAWAVLLAITRLGLAALSRAIELDGAPPDEERGR